MSFCYVKVMEIVLILRLRCLHWSDLAGLSMLCPGVVSDSKETVFLSDFLSGHFGCVYGRVVPVI